MTIKERAQSYTDKVGILGAYQGYIVGATEQKQIDIDKACEWLGYCLPEMEYITNASALRQKKKEFIESFREAMEVETCNSDKNLQELTWQDIRRIVEIADDDRLLQHCSEYGLTQEQYYIEVLKQFNESKD